MFREANLEEKEEGEKEDAVENFWSVDKLYTLFKYILYILYNFISAILTFYSVSEHYLRLDIYKAIKPHFPAFVDLGISKSWNIVWKPPLCVVSSSFL